MAAIADSLSEIQIEETDFQSSVGEGLATRLGANQNFMFNRMFQKHIWRYNGLTGKFSTDIGADGPIAYMYDWEISGFGYSINSPGSASSTIFDIRNYTLAGVDNGSIFSTKPEVDNTADAYSTTLYNQLTSTTISNPTGHTLGVISDAQVDAGEQLVPVVDQGMTGGLDFFFWIYYRSRNP